MSTRIFDTMEERLNFLDFRQELLFENKGTSRILFEHQITQEEANLLYDLMDSYRNRINKGETVTSIAFESDVYRIIPIVDRDYNFCESITKNFMLEERWEIVFDTLYGHLPKYRTLNRR